jgi:hypothetical protein
MNLIYLQNNYKDCNEQIITNLQKKQDTKRLECMTLLIKVGSRNWKTQQLLII